ncbi:hypothetical protein Tco_0198973 [Tanacetum coccineum]
MAQMGFGVKWRKWIYACLSSASVSILINGSPSKEFPMKRGLRQGDPLLPFLFLIVAEALQVMVTDSCNKGGRLTLVKSVLGSLPLYFLSLFKAPEDATCGELLGVLRKVVSDLNGLTLDESQEDKWEWALTTSRKFTVASLCRAILLRVNTNDVSAPRFS